MVQPSVARPLCAPLVVFILVCLVRPAGAATVSYFDADLWRNAVSGITAIVFTPASVELADEVSGTVVFNDRFGAQLNFAASNTGLPVGFSFNVDPTEPIVPGNEIILVGGGLGVATNFTQHDWRIDLGAGQPVYAMGITLNGIGVADERHDFLGPGGQLLASFPGSAAPMFIGIVTDVPITGFLYDDTNLSGGRVLFEMAFGTAVVPLPAALWLGLPAVGLLLRLRRVPGCPGEPNPAG